MGSASTKAARKMALKLTPGVNFINVLCTAFALVDRKSVKNTVKSLVSFMLLRSMSIKVVRRMVLKLTPGVMLG